MATSSKASLLLKAIGEDAWKKSEKINGELFILMYGALVVQIIKDYEDMDQVNTQLDRLGYNIGTKLIEDFLVKSNLTNVSSKCRDLRETAEVISKIAFKMFLNIVPTVAHWSGDGKEFSLILEDNPLIEYAELPQAYIDQGLQYCSMLCGVIRGALEMMHIQAEVSLTKCALRNRGEHTQIKEEGVVRVMVLNVKNDVELTPSATDGISDISFSPAADFVAASSWDGQMRIWEIQPHGSAVAKTAVQHNGPVLSCAWSQDGMKVFSGGADKTIKVLDVPSGQSMTINAHDQPVKCLKWMNSGNAQVLVSGSWDRTLKYWDLRSPNPMAVVTLPERCYSMDIAKDLLVVGTAERHICIYNLQNPTQLYKNMPSPLKWQTRTVACFPDGTGYAVGSIEGRVGLQYIDENMQKDNFAFKCHREASNVYPVNHISFHPVHGTFSTAGSDGYIHIWDKGSKQRLESSPSLGSQVPCTAFSRNGNYFAYALSYDWFKGHEHYRPGARNAIMIHSVQESEVKPRSSSSFRSRR